MSRSINSTLNAEFNKDSLSLIFFIKSVWNSGTVYLWTGYEDITFDGQTWSGAGHLVGISSVNEEAKIHASGVDFQMSGIPGSLVSLILDDARQGNEVSLWVGAIDQSQAIVGTPYKLFQGLMDVPSIQEGASSSTITVTAENRLIELNRANTVRYTDRFQQDRFTGDLGLEYVAGMQNKEVHWGTGGNSGVTAPVATDAGSGMPLAVGAQISSTGGGQSTLPAHTRGRRG